MKSLGFKRVKLADITVGDRMREEYEEIEELKDSIDENILMHPLVVSPDMVLIAGGRRFKALELLGIERNELIDVDVHVIACDQDYEYKELELIENLARKEMSWQDVIKGQEQLHKMKQRIHGGGKGHHAVEVPVLDPETGKTKLKKENWKVDDTAELLGISPSNMNRSLRIAKYLQDDKYKDRIEKAENPAQAMKIILKIREEELAAELKKRQDTRKATLSEDEVLDSISSRFFCMDSIEHVRTIQDDSIDLILTDPPYGINIANLTRQHDRSGADGHYDDSEENFWNLMNELVPHFYRVLKPDSWFIMFFAIEFYEDLKELLNGYGFSTIEKPFIWVKTTHSATNIPEHRLGSQYECAFMVRKGMPPINVQGKGDVFICRGLSGTEKIHPAQKPLELISHMIEVFSTVGARVYDPFAGSGVTAAAALDLERDFLCVELDQTNHAVAIDRLKNYVTKDELVNATLAELKDDPTATESDRVRMAQITEFGASDAERPEYFGRIETSGRDKLTHFISTGKASVKVEEGSTFLTTFVETFARKKMTTCTVEDIIEWYKNRSNDPAKIFDPNDPEDKSRVERANFNVETA